LPPPNDAVPPRPASHEQLLLKQKRELDAIAAMQAAALQRARDEAEAERLTLELLRREAEEAEAEERRRLAEESAAEEERLTQQMLQQEEAAAAALEAQRAEDDRRTQAYLQALLEAEGQDIVRLLEAQTQEGGGGQSHGPAAAPAVTTASLPTTDPVNPPAPATLAVPAATPAPASARAAVASRTATGTGAGTGTGTGSSERAAPAGAAAGAGAAGAPVAAVRPMGLTFGAGAAAGTFHQHALERSRRSTSAPGGWRCDVCKRPGAASELSWRCNACNYDECQACFGTTRS
jgi:hypothetical protein